MKKECKKKKYREKYLAIRTLYGITRNTQNPDRNEMIVYQCENCGFWHLSSNNDKYGTGYVITDFRGKTYFEIQKEKYGKFLHEHSATKPYLK